MACATRQRQAAARSEGVEWSLICVGRSKWGRRIRLATAAILNTGAGGSNGRAAGTLANPYQPMLAHPPLPPTCG